MAPIFVAMKRWGRFTVILIAYGLTFLHAAVPHHHDQHQRILTVTPSCPYHSQPLGLLQRALSIDLGAGHLETFKSNDQVRLSFPTLETAALADINPGTVAPVVSARVQTTYVEDLTWQPSFSAPPGLRAPPQRSSNS